jgi:hypothetical protein
MRCGTFFEKRFHASKKLPCKKGDRVAVKFNSIKENKILIYSKGEQRK